jgi:hypothetical protein
MKFSTETFDENMIGKIYLDGKNPSINVRNMLILGEERIFDLDATPNNVELINGQIFLTNPANRCLTIYDQDLNLVKRIDRIDGGDFHPFGITYDSIEKFIYICDHSNCRVLMTDSDFNLIKSVGSEGIKDNQFNEPTDIYYKNKNLYICDCANKRIQIYSSNLDFAKSVKLDYEPWKIKATNSIVCVKGWLSTEIYFYNSVDFSVIQKYNHEIGRISQINSFFYEFNYLTNKVYCYDQNGILYEEISLNRTDLVLSNIYDGAFIGINDYLLMISNSLKKIIKFSKF